MPTLLDDTPLQTADETSVEAFDFERLARISAAQTAIEPPRFAMLEPAPRFRFRRTLVMAFLAAVTVSGFSTLRPEPQSAFTPSLVNPPARSTDTTGGACAIGD